MKTAPSRHQRIPDILHSLDTSFQGIDAHERHKRLAKYGKNTLQRKKTVWTDILIKQVKSPFIFILLIAAGISVALNNLTEGILIMCFVIINTILGFSQEYQSNKAIELLKQYLEPTCSIKENGEEKTITCDEVVPGDIMLIRAGDVIAADATIISSTHLLIDESILTGESHPKEKTILNDTQVFAGTKVIEGAAETVVIKTGLQTRMGSIAAHSELEGRRGSFERGIEQFSKVILKMVGLTLVLILLANAIIKGTDFDLATFILFAIALAVSVIPEALPLVTTISLSRGAVHLAKKHVVVKHLSALEDLGSIEILCTDKTGTITENKLSVVDIFSDQKDDCLLYAHLGNTTNKTKRQSNNAFDHAINTKISHQQLNLAKKYHILNELPFDPIRKRNSVVVERMGIKELIVRGAPETLINECLDIHKAQSDEILAWCRKQGQLGRRTIAIGCKRLSIHAKDIAEEEKNLQFLGIIAFEDPLKHSAKQAIASAEAAGIQVKILTGDSREVAEHIGKQIKLVKDKEDVITGDEWDALSPKEKQRRTKSIQVFARVSPEQKFRVIQELQRTYEVGFLGEGINDAPALKVADVGLVVKEGSDIAREAADVILLNKSLHVIIDGITEGRHIFANTVKYIKATLTSNFGNFYAVAISSLFINHLPMLPVQLLLVNLLSDFPMIAISADTVDKEELTKPKRYDVRDIIVFCTFLGLVSTIFDFLFFGLYFRQDPAVLHTNWFIGSILTELFLIYSIRTKKPFWKSSRPSGWLTGLTGIAIVATIIIPFLPFTRTIFSFTQITIQQLTFTIGIALAYFITTEIVKQILCRKQAK